MAAPAPTGTGAFHACRVLRHPSYWGLALGFGAPFAVSAAVTTFLHVGEPARATIFGAAFLGGLSLGGLLPMNGILIASAFGPASFGSVMGLMGPVMTPMMIAALLLVRPAATRDTDPVRRTGALSERRDRGSAPPGPR